MLLTEVAPLARYGHLNMLSPWADLATRRPQAIWVLVPQLSGSYGALIDRRPLRLPRPRSSCASTPTGSPPTRAPRFPKENDDRHPALTTALQQQVRALVEDLRKRVDKNPELRAQWQQEHRRANEKERTAWSWVECATTALTR